MQEFIITFRESLEASLIIGIFITYFNKLNNKAAIHTIWKSTAAALLASIIFAYGLYIIRLGFNNSSFEKLFESILMYITAGILIYMIVWMRSRVNIKQEIEQQASSVMKKTGLLSLFLLVFFAIAREGFETVLILIGSTQTNFSYLGFFGGIICAVLIGTLIFIQGKRVPIKHFFNITSIILIFFAAGMIAYGTHELEEYLTKSGSIDKENITKAWDIYKPLDSEPSSNLYALNIDTGKYHHILHDKGKVGIMLKGLFGYNSDPSRVEFFLWLFSLLGAFYLWKKGPQLLSSPAQ